MKYNFPGFHVGPWQIKPWEANQNSEYFSHQVLEQGETLPSPGFNPRASREL